MIKNVNTTTFRGIYDDYIESGIYIYICRYIWNEEKLQREEDAKKKQKTKKPENKTKTNIINNYAIYLLYK